MKTTKELFDKVAEASTFCAYMAQQEYLPEPAKKLWRDHGALCTEVGEQLTFLDKSGHPELAALREENQRLRELARTHEIDRDMKDYYERLLTEIGKSIGCGHLDDRLPSCVSDAVERAEQIDRTIRDAKLIGALEEAYRGKEGLWPDWIYEARRYREHQEGNIPWLPDLLRTLGWKGGNVHQALGSGSSVC